MTTQRRTSTGPAAAGIAAVAEVARRLLPDDGRDHRPRAAAHLRVRRAGALPRHAGPGRHPRGRRAARRDRAGVRRAPGALRRPRLRHRPVRRGAAARRGRADRDLEDAHDHRRTPRGPARCRRARRDQPRRHQGRDARGLLLRAGPVEPADLLDRRQRRGELRRRALPEVRLHHQPRPRRRLRHRRRRHRPARRRRARQPGLRPARRRRRLRGHARHRHLGDRPAGPAARGGAHDPGRLRVAPTRPAPRPRRSSPPASCPPPSR